MNTVKFLLAILASIVITACGGGGGGGGVTPPVNLKSIAISPANPTVTVLTTASLTALATYSDNSTLDVSATVTWASNDSAVVTVNSSGTATGMAVGTATVTASLNGVTSPGATVTVTAATLTGISISPSAVSVPLGLTQQFTATGTFNNNTSGDVSGSVTWSSDTPANATLNGSGLATVPNTATIGGTASISATSGALTSNTATLTVSAPVLHVISVSPAAISVPRGTTQQFTATGAMSDGTPATLGAITWSSGTLSNATIDANGLATVPNTATSAGTSVISATSGGITGSTTLTVGNPNLVSIAVTGGSLPVTGGVVYIPRGTSQQFTAIGTYSDSTTADLSSASIWSSGTPANATVVAATGLVTAPNTATLFGYATISAASGGITGQRVIRVDNPVMLSIAISPTSTTVPTHLTRQFTAIATYSDATLLNVTNSVAWSSSDALKATIGNTGLATGVAVGSSTITATSGAVTSSTGLTTVVQQTWVSGSNNGNAWGVYGTKGTAAATNIPGARYGSVSWTDSSNNLWMFGGYGYNSGGAYAYLNDLWKWDGTNWTWVSGSNTVNAPGVYGTQGVAAATNTPGARNFSIGWADTAGNLWLFGGTYFVPSYTLFGTTYPAVTYYYNELWKFNIASGQWTWVSGSISAPGGVYGTQGTAAATNIPGARYGAVASTDSANNVWLFGGIGFDGNNAFSRLNDLWKWDGTNWTWVSGSNTVNAYGVYGTQGVATATNVPGARNSSISWTDTAGNFWLFGGEGYGATTLGLLNDLWKWDGANWTWVSGSDARNTLGVYGIKGTADAASAPGARRASISWSDTSGNLWLFGGFGFDSAFAGWQNDLWKWDGSNWTWMSGDSISTGVGDYRTKGTPNAANNPGGREYSNFWKDTAGNMWMFGGNGYDSTATLGAMNDLWRINP